MHSEWLDYIIPAVRDKSDNMQSIISVGQRYYNPVLQ